LNAEQAKDVMLAVFKDAWDALRTATPALGYGETYEDVPGSMPTAATALWARVTVRHATGRQSSLTGGLGTQRYTNKGFVWVQVFAPMGDGSTAGYVASQAVVDAYRDANTSVLFRNVRLNEQGGDGSFTKFDVIADFEYDDVR
jgi:hypothetical protein